MDPVRGCLFFVLHDIIYGMRDFILVLGVLGVLAGFGCGTALAKSDLTQYRAESPNYSLEYLEEGMQPPAGDVRGEQDPTSQDVQFEVFSGEIPPATTLPATNPPYVIGGAILVSLAAAAVVYFILKK